MRGEDRVRIQHMIDAVDTAMGFMAGRPRSDLDSNRMLLFAVVHAIEVLGEAAGRVSEELRSQHPDIPWSAIVSMRNRLIHGYFDVDTEIVWKTLTDELPPLERALRKLMGEA